MSRYLRDDAELRSFVLSLDISDARREVILAELETHIEMEALSHPGVDHASVFNLRLRTSF